MNRTVKTVMIMVTAAVIAHLVIKAIDKEV